MVLFSTTSKRKEFGFSLGSDPDPFPLSRAVLGWGWVWDRSINARIVGRTTKFLNDHPKRSRTRSSRAVI